MKQARSAETVERFETCRKTGLLAGVLLIFPILGLGIWGFANTIGHSLTNFAHGDWRDADAINFCLDLLFWAIWTGCLSWVLVLVLTRSPYRLSLDGKGNLLATSLILEQGIALSDIVSIEYDSTPPNPHVESPTCITIKHRGGEIEVPPFQRQQDFLLSVSAAQPSIRISDVAWQVKEVWRG